MTQDAENGQRPPMPSPPNFLIRDMAVRALEGALEPMPVPVQAPATEVEPQRNLIEELSVLIGQEPQVPNLGAEASQRMRQAFSIIAADIRGIAKKRVEEALELQQEAESYATVILNAGDELCKKIERDASRVYQASMVIRKAQEIIGQTPFPE